MNKYVAAVLGGGFCWGFMGFFVRHLAQFGIDSNGAVVVRCGIAAVCFGILILCTDPGAFRIRRKDIWCFLGTGLLSLLFFTFCYFHAISMMDLSTRCWSTAWTSRRVTSARSPAFAAASATSSRAARSWRG